MQNNCKLPRSLEVFTWHLNLFDCLCASFANFLEFESLAAQIIAWRTHICFQITRWKTWRKVSLESGTCGLTCILTAFAAYKCFHVALLRVSRSNILLRMHSLIIHNFYIIIDVCNLLWGLTIFALYIVVHELLILLMRQIVRSKFGHLIGRWRKFVAIVAPHPNY